MLPLYQSWESSNDGGQQSKKLLMWACKVTLVLVFLTSAASATATKPVGRDKPEAKGVVARPTAAVATDSTVVAACKDTLYPAACESALASVAGTKSAKSSKKLFDVSVEFAMAKAHAARSLAYNLTFPRKGNSGPYPPTGTYDCVELLDTTLSLLGDVLGGGGGGKQPKQEDAKTWLSAALTNLVTCSDSLKSRPPAAGEASMQSDSESLTQFISNSLALCKTVKKRQPRAGWMTIFGGGSGSGRKLLSEDGFPSWVSAGDRKLLSTPSGEIVADAVVAADGSGTHRSITEALAALTLKEDADGEGGSSGGGGRQVIYVKAGTYKETIRVLKGQKNVMLVGDGKGKSVIVGSRNAEDGWTTYQSATVAAQGPGFIARDLTIINNSGPSKQQAVALRVGADRAVIHRCSIEGYQDTLYAHANRQFYRDCDIYGTVDFVFGNAAAVFQNCHLSPRRPNSGQKNSVTAQGRSDPNQNTGFSIQGCRVSPTGDLAAVKGRVPTYLGRPWHKFSRVVVMQTYLDDAVHPAGWEPWSGGFALSTLYYGEYGNTGPGAATGGRVRWPGVHPKMSAAEASGFTVGQFIAGNSWLPSTGVDFTVGL
ncbi:hypothetical protein Taro_021247 [Colocasia esculenta]|uniref:Pectinesterase n=1 Tax=Colocasia esculenta TaxID=4460 RepID=A0A843UYG4_COLES|nr:hypothetical protein [Colocasia esculenta]